jgi:hypothetical protein
MIVVANRMTKSSVTTKVFIPWRSIVQISEGIMGVPAITALWYASSILKDQLGKEKNYPRLIKEVHLV